MYTALYFYFWFVVKSDAVSEALHQAQGDLEALKKERSACFLHKYMYKM